MINRLTVETLCLQVCKGSWMQPVCLRYYRSKLLTRVHHLDVCWCYVRTQNHFSNNSYHEFLREITFSTLIKVFPLWSSLIHTLSTESQVFISVFVNRTVQTWCCFSGCCHWVKGRGTWLTARCSKSPDWYVHSVTHKVLFMSAKNTILMYYKSILINWPLVLILICLQDLEVVTRFLPAMMSVVVDDHTYTVEQKLPSEEKSSLSYPTTLPDAFTR